MSSSGKSQKKKGMFSRFRPKVVRETGPPQRQQTTSCQPHEDPPSTIPSQNTSRPVTSQHTPPTIPSEIHGAPAYGYSYAPIPSVNMFPSIYENVYRPTFPEQPEIPTDTQQSQQPSPPIYQQFEPFMHPALMRSSSSGTPSHMDFGSPSQQQGQQAAGERTVFHSQPRRRGSTSQPYAAGNEQDSETSSGEEEDDQNSNVRNASEEESLAPSDDACFVPEDARFKAGRIMPRGRTYIKPKGKSSFNPPNVSKRMRTELLFGNWNGPYMTYQTALREDRDTWWKLFQAKYMWKKSRDWKVRRNYKNKMCKIISDAFYQGRKKHLNDPSAWKLPEFVRMEHSEAILNKMRSDEGYLKRSQRAQQNARGRTHDPYIHHLSSQPAHIAYARQQSRSEEIITPNEFYKYTHTDRRTGVINPEALKKAEEMEMAVAMLSDGDPTFASLHPIAQQMQIWPSIHGTEGSSNEYRGLGTQADYFLDKYGNGGSYTSGESSTGTSARRPHAAQQTAQQEADINAQIAAQVEAAVKAHMDTLRNEDIAAQIQRAVEAQMNTQFRNELNPDITSLVEERIQAQISDLRDQLRTDIYAHFNIAARSHMSSRRSPH